MDGQEKRRREDSVKNLIVYHDFCQFSHFSTEKRENETKHSQSVSRKMP
jgi:hypothetical protein